jgi:hypothetical protein
VTDDTDDDDRPDTGRPGPWIEPPRVDLAGMRIDPGADALRAVRESAPRWLAELLPPDLEAARIARLPH